MLCKNCNFELVLKELVSSICPNCNTNNLKSLMSLLGKKLSISQSKLRVEIAVNLYNYDKISAEITSLKNNVMQTSMFNEAILEVNKQLEADLQKKNQFQWKSKVNVTYNNILFKTGKIKYKNHFNVTDVDILEDVLSFCIVSDILRLEDI